MVDLDQVGLNIGLWYLAELLYVMVSVLDMYICAKTVFRALGGGLTIF